MWNGLYLEADQTIFKPDHHSEIFAFRAIDILPDNGKILDLGCGSGAIGLLIKKQKPQIKVTFSDINEQALLDTTNNIIQNGFTEQDFVLMKSNMFQDIPLEEKYDLIIGYLPFNNFLYMFRIKNNRLHALTSHIVGNDSDELLLLKDLIITGKQYLNQIGHIFFKVKNDQQLVILADLMQQNNYTYEMFSSIYDEEGKKTLVDATFLGD